MTEEADTTARTPDGPVVATRQKTGFIRLRYAPRLVYTGRPQESSTTATTFPSPGPGGGEGERKAGDL